MVSLGTMIAVVWYARLHLARDENWTLTLKNGLGRALFLTLTLGAFYLYNRLSRIPLRQQSLTVVVGLAFILFLVLDFLTHVPRQNPVVSRLVFQPGLARLSPQPRHGDGRAMISAANNLKLYRFATTNAVNDYINNRRLLFANCNLLDAIPKLNGFYSLYLRDSDTVRAFLYDSTNAPPAPLCDFLGVSQMTDPNNFLEWKFRPGYLPLASVGQKPVFADGAKTFKAITSAEFDPRQTVYLPLEARSFASAVAAHEPTPSPSPEGNFTNASARGLPSEGGAGGGFAAREQVQLENERPAQSKPPTGSHLEAKVLAAAFTAHRGEIEIEARGPSWLSIAQNYHHCWRAYADGTPLRLWQANYAFQAALVPEGKHLVKLIYRDWGFVAGVMLSIMTLIGCIVGAGIRLKRGHATSARQ